MKYTSNNKPLQCIMTNSTCYKQTSAMTIKGVLWHSTGSNNPSLKRYVQPSSNDANYKALLAKIGTNNYANDWNHIYHKAGVNAWIGKFADGTVGTVQTLPWNYKPWGCGSGSKGSCNNGWIQFEICEDALTDKNYAMKVYQEACELTAYLCKSYGINPKGKVSFNGVSVPTILCHYDSYHLGLGSNHGDVLHWFPKLIGKSMEDVRNDVAALIYGTNTTTKPTAPTTPTPTKKEGIKVGDVIKLQPGATYVSGKSIPTWIINSTLYAREIRKNGNIIFSTLKSGAVTGVVNQSQLVGSKDTNSNTITATNYSVRVTADVLNIRSGPGTSYLITGTIRNKGVYTIVQESGRWGKLKSGAGWISLDYTKKV